MMYKTLAVATLAFAAASAQVNSAIPQCAHECFSSAIAVSGCSLSDYYCQCTSGSAKIKDAVTPCLLKSTCTTGDVDGINAAVTSICAAAIKAGSTTGSSGEAAAASPSGSGSNSTTASTSSASAAMATGSTASSSAAASSSSSSSTSGANMLRAGSALLGLSLAAVFAL